MDNPNTEAMGVMDGSGDQPDAGVPSRMKRGCTFADRVAGRPPVRGCPQPDAREIGPDGRYVEESD